MIGRLPTSLPINGKSYRIRSDFRDILRIIAAYQDDELTDAEKALVCLANIYKDFKAIPERDYQAAYDAAAGFIDYGIREDRPSPRVLDWEHDESIIFPAINKSAGAEVRLLPYCHWWTFLGYFHSIDRESTLGVVLMVRQKKAKRKKLEKWEQDFWLNNRNLCDLKATEKASETPENTLAAIYKELLAAQAEGGGDEDGRV